MYQLELSQGAEKRTAISIRIACQNYRVTCPRLFGQVKHESVGKKSAWNLAALLLEDGRARGPKWAIKTNWISFWHEQSARRLLRNIILISQALVWGRKLFESWRSIKEIKFPRVIVAASGKSNSARCRDNTQAPCDVQPVEKRELRRWSVLRHFFHLFPRNFRLEWGERAS